MPLLVCISKTIRAACFSSVASQTHVQMIRNLVRSYLYHKLPQSETSLLYKKFSLFVSSVMSCIEMNSSKWTKVRYSLYIRCTHNAVEMKMPFGWVSTNACCPKWELFKIVWFSILKKVTSNIWVSHILDFFNSKENEITKIPLTKVSISNNRALLNFRSIPFHFDWYLYKWTQWKSKSNLI